MLLRWKSTFPKNIKVNQTSKFGFKDNLKKTVFASNRDGLVLLTLWYVSNLAQKQEFGWQLSRRFKHIELWSKWHLYFTFFMWSKSCPLFWSKKIKIERLCNLMNTTKFLPAHTGANMLMSPKEPFFSGLTFFKLKTPKLN